MIEKAFTKLHNLTDIMAKNPGVDWSPDPSFIAFFGQGYGSSAKYGMIMNMTLANSNRVAGLFQNNGNLLATIRHTSDSCFPQSSGPDA